MLQIYTTPYTSFLSPLFFWHPQMSWRNALHTFSSALKAPHHHHLTSPTAQPWIVFWSKSRELLLLLLDPSSLFFFPSSFVNYTNSTESTAKVSAHPVVVLVIVGRKRYMGWNGFHRRAPVDLPATVERGHASSLAAIINKELRRGRKERKNRQQETRKKKNRFGIERRKKLTGGRGLQREDAKRCGSDHQFSQHFIDRLTELYYSSWWEPTAATAERSPPFIMTTRTSVGFHRMRKKKKKKRKKK